MIENVLSRETLLGHSRQEALQETRKTVREKDLEEALAEGWVVRKRNARSVSVSRPKKRSSLLESRVWTLLYRMGFPVMSGKGGAQLNIGGEKGPRSQIDVVVVDSEIGLCIECKSFEAPRKEPQFQEKLARHETLRKPFANAISKAFPNPNKRHVASLFFTWDVILTENDLLRAEEADVTVFDLKDLEYFEELVRLLGPAARYQFLAEVFRGRSIEGLELRIPALRSKMGKFTYYTFAIRPEYLLKISYVAHRAKGKSIDLDAYQRMISKSRLKNIAQYITDDGVFPTNIVVNLEQERYLKFDRGEQKGTEHGALFGWVTLSPTYGAARIIDGQHRLFAYSGHPRASRSYLNVLAFAGLSDSKQTQLFVDINSEQRRVKRSLLVELDAVLKWESEDDNKRIDAIVSRAALAMDADLASPLYGRLLPADVQKTDTRCITLTSVTGAINKPGFFIIAEKKGITEYGPLWRNNTTDSMVRTNKVVSGWLRPIAAGAEEWWSLGMAVEGGGLAMSNGVTICINVLRSVLDHLGDNTRLSLLDNDDLIQRITPYAKAVGNYFGRMSPDDRKMFRQLQGVNGQTTGTKMCQAALQEEFPKFDPPGLSDWVARSKSNTNQQARSIIEKLEKALQDVILGALKSQYPNGDDWWYQGVPAGIRKKIADRIEETGGKAGTREQNFDLVHYREIIEFQWPLLGDVLGYGDTGNKKRKTEWIYDVTLMRNIVSHASRREHLSFEKVGQLNAYWDWLSKRITERDLKLTS